MKNVLLNCTKSSENEQIENFIKMFDCYMTRELKVNCLYLVFGY